MAALNVGQRVKYVNTILNPQVPTGAIGVIVRIGGITPTDAYTVDFFGYPPFSGRGWGVYAHSVVPLTDQKADEFIERIKKLAREPAPREKQSA